MEHQNAPEEVVFSLRTHPKVLFAPGMVLLMVLAGTLATALYVPTDGLYQWVQLACWGVLALLTVGGVVVPLVRWYTATFTVTTRQIQTRSGLIARNGSDVLLARITNVDIEQGLLDRIFGCGTLIIKDAGSPEGMELRDIPGVQRVRETINELAYQETTGRK